MTEPALFVSCEPHGARVPCDILTGNVHEWYKIRDEITESHMRMKEDSWEKIHRFPRKYL